MDETDIIGVDLGATNIRAGLIRGSSLETVIQTATPADGSVDEVMQEIYGLIEHFDGDAVSGIGIGVPSVVDVDEGIVYEVQNIPSWDKVPVKALLEERYSVPAFVNNDANCFALGEYHFGKGAGYGSMIGLILGTGFAGGIVLDGQLYTGPNCGAGEFGMMPYKDSVYEHYCAGLFFERQYNVDGKEVYQRAIEGDPWALERFDEMGHHLGSALKAVLYAYDPECIVFGGSVRHAYSYFEEAMWEVLNTFAYSRTVDRLTLEVSELDNVAVLGAAALVYDAKPRQTPTP